MKTSRSAQPLGFLDVELRVQWLWAKDNPLNQVDVDERILPALHWAAAPRGGDWPDQPDLQPGPLQTDRAVEVVATDHRLKIEEQNQKRGKTNQQRKLEHQKNTDQKRRHESQHTEN
jgi:hypothetical protein